MLTIQPRPNRLTRLIDKHASVVIKLDHAPIRPLNLLSRANDNGVSDVSSSDLVGDTAAAGGFYRGPVLLDNDDDAVT